MANHVRQQIREAAATALTGLATTGGNVFQSRMYPIAQSSLPCLAISTNSESIDPGTIHVALDRNLELLVEAVAESTSNVDDVLDTIIKEVEIAMDANTTLGGLVNVVSLNSIEIDFNADSELKIGRAIMRFNVNYFTNAGAPDVSL